jgi:hypothetical protein
VSIVEPRLARAVTVTACDEAARVVRGPLSRYAGCASPVARMSTPEIELADGRREPRRVCLVRPDGVRLCANAGASVEVGTLVDASWQVEIPLVQGESCAPSAYPALAAMTFEIDCGG